MLDVALIVGGLVLLFVGGEGLLRGAVALAERFGLSKFLVSAVIVGFGTSMPEMVVSVGAALKGAPDIALGNVVGSNIANILLIVGIAALLAPIKVNVQEVRRETYVMLGAAALLCGLSLFGVINFMLGLLMFALLLGHVGYSYHLDRTASKKARKAKKDAGIVEEMHPHAFSLPVAVMFCVAGLGMLVLGAEWLVQGASSLARGLGISDAVIGLTVVAVGTSLPELATAAVAAYRKHSEMILGNILGSNVFNVLSILGVTAMVTPVPFIGQIANLDVWLMLMVSLAFGGMLLSGMRLGRATGAAMVGVYAAYTLWLYVGAA